MSYGVFVGEDLEGEVGEASSQEERTIEQGNA